MDKDILQSVIKMISKYNQGNNVNKKRKEKLKSRNFEERRHQKLYVLEAPGKKSTSSASLSELKILCNEE